MRRHRNARLIPLLIAACLFGSALVALPAARAENLSIEEIAEEAALKEEAGDFKDADEPDYHPESEEGSGEDAPIEPIDEKDVVVLTQDTFRDTIKKHQYALVEFYAPWCGHCQALAPEWAKAATALKASNPDILVAKVDATEQPDLGREFAVEGYPTIKWFVDGEALEYGGGRVEKEIVKWVKKKTGPPAPTIETVAELDALKASNGPLVVGYFAKLEGKGHEAFEGAARGADDVEFVQTTSSAVAKAAGLDKEGVVLLRTFEGEAESFTYNGAADDKEALKSWVKAEKVPPYVEFTEENQEAIFGSGIPLNIIVVAKPADMKKGSPVTKALRAAHAVAKGQAIFVLCDREGDAAEPIVEFFDIAKDAELPKVVAFHMTTTRKYFMPEGAVDEESLAAFAKGVVDGTVEAFFKSEAVPSGDDAKDGGVAVVVGKNFEEIVMDSKRDVLLEAYAPWCGHCKQLAPTWKKLAKRFKDIDSVVVAKIDATANEHAALAVEGFPTILLFPAGSKDKKPIQYSGDRSLKGLSEFIKKEAKVSFTLKQKAEELAEEEKADEAEAAKAAEAEAEAEGEGGEEDAPGDAEFGDVDMGEWEGEEGEVGEEGEPIEVDGEDAGDEADEDAGEEHDEL